MIVHGIVRLSFQTVCCFFEPIAARFSTFLISEHEADDEVTSTHCHFLVDISEHFAQLDSFRAYLKRNPDYYAIFQRPSDMELHTKTMKKKLPYQVKELAIYIIKRNCFPKQYGSHFTQQLIMEYSSLWSLQNPIRNTPNTDDNIGKNEPITETPKKNKITQWQLLQFMMEEEDERFGQIPDKPKGTFYAFSDDKIPKVHPSILFDIVVRVMKRYHQIPHPTQVDKFIGSMINICNNVNHNEYQHASYSRYLK